jgi:hypothetical protein
MHSDHPTDQTTIAFVLDYPNEAAEELERLRKIQAAALRVASSRRNGIVTDQGALDLLDQALEST